MPLTGQIQLHKESVAVQGALVANHILILRAQLGKVTVHQRRIGVAQSNQPLKVIEHAVRHFCLIGSVQAHGILVDSDPRGAVGKPGTRLCRPLHRGSAVVPRAAVNDPQCFLRLFALATSLL